MASDDIYVRKDVYEADQRALRAEIRLGNEEVLKELRQFRVEINGKIEEVRAELNGKIEEVRTELNGKITEFREEVNNRFSKLEAKVEVLTGRVDGLEMRINALDHRIDRIEGYVGTGIAFIAMLVTVVVFIEPISRFVRKIFKPEPTITIEQIEALIDSKLKALR